MVFVTIPIPQSLPSVHRHRSDRLYVNHLPGKPPSFKPTEAEFIAFYRYRRIIRVTPGGNFACSGGDNDLQAIFKLCGRNHRACRQIICGVAMFGKDRPYWLPVARLLVHLFGRVNRERAAVFRGSPPGFKAFLAKSDQCCPRLVDRDCLHAVSSCEILESFYRSPFLM